MYGPLMQKYFCCIPLSPVIAGPEHVSSGTQLENVVIVMGIMERQ